MFLDTTISDAGTPAVRMQRAEGAARASFRMREGRSRLATLYQEGCAKIRLPRPVEAAHAPEAVLINTAGGLTGGDRFAVEIAVAEAARAVISTQACERIYRSTGADARVANTLRVGSGARLCWLPQETILFNGARLARRLEVDLEGDAELLAVEAVLWGRQAMGESVSAGFLHDRWRVRRDGRLIFAEDFRVDGAVAEKLARPAALGGRRAMATVLHVSAAPERVLDEARGIAGAEGGASVWGGKLVVRLVAESGLLLRRRLEPLLGLLAPEQPLPKVWQL